MYLTQEVEVPEVGLDSQFHLIYHLCTLDGILFHHLHLCDFRGGVDGLELDIAPRHSSNTCSYRHCLVDRHSHIDACT